MSLEPELKEAQRGGAAGPALIARRLRKAYQAPGGRLDVLRGLDLTVQRGEFVAIVGASGSGKSTLLNLLGTLDRADEGTLEIAGRRVETMTEDERCTLRSRGIGFVYQFHHLLPEFTAEENVMMPMLIAGRPPDLARAEAAERLAAVGLDARRAHLPAQLSGGEAQRVAVARAIASEPELLLADEPSGNLDESNAEGLHDLLSSMARTRHQTVVLVTHNDRLAARADRMLRLHDGVLHAVTPS